MSLLPGPLVDRLLKLSGCLKLEFGCFKPGNAFFSENLDQLVILMPVADPDLELSGKGSFFFLLTLQVFLSSPISFNQGKGVLGPFLRSATIKS